MRREFSTKVRDQAYERSKGRCEKCGAEFAGRRCEYDHRIPCALGGEPTLENCDCVCPVCHRQKTSTQDIPAISKCKRIIAKTANIKPRRQWPKRKVRIA